jgi:hypothetical protein
MHEMKQYGYEVVNALVTDLRKRMKNLIRRCLASMTAWLIEYTIVFCWLQSRTVR